MGLACDCIIFDMDGTLTRPQLDFDWIRAQLGIAPGEAVLEVLAGWAEDDREAAHAKLLAWELEAAAEAEPIDGAVEVVQRIRRAKIPCALLTRNCREAMRIVLDRLGLSFDLAWAREDAPPKPDPQSVLSICRAFAARPGHTVSVGDFVFDVQAANAAGAVSVLLARGRTLDFAAQADIVIETLYELPEIIGL